MVSPRAQSRRALLSQERQGDSSLSDNLEEMLAEVHHEVTVAGHGLPGAEEVREARWIEVVTRRSPEDPSLEQACEGLGAGECGTILLAKAGQGAPCRARSPG